jgi:hypothetical protein
MAGKTPETIDPAKLVEEVTALIERITAVAIAGDDVEPLKEEAEALIKQLPTKDRTKLRATVRKAAESKPTEAPKVLEGVVTMSSEAATVETVDPYSVDGVKEIADEASTAIAEGLAAQLKVSELARKMASSVLTARVCFTDKDGRPDIMAKSRAARKLTTDILDEAARKAGHDPEKKDPAVVDALGRLQRSIQHQMDDVRVKYIRELDESPEEAAKFAKVLESAPEGMKISDALFAAYEIPSQSKIERMAAQAAIERGEGGESTEGSEAGAGDGSKPRIVTWIDAAEEELEKAGKADLKRAKLTDDQREDTLARIAKIKSLAVSLEVQLRAQA